MNLERVSRKVREQYFLRLEPNKERDDWSRGMGFKVIVTWVDNLGEGLNPRVKLLTEFFWIPNSRFHEISLSFLGQSFRRKIATNQRDTAAALEAEVAAAISNYVETSGRSYLAVGEIIEGVLIWEVMKSQ